MKGMRDHSVIEELISVRALGGLDPDDEARLESDMSAHGDCAECRRLRDDYEEVAGRLAFSLDPEPVGAGVEDETVARARRATPIQAAGRGGPLAWRGLVAVAASLVLFAGGWLARGLTSGGEVDVAAALEGARVVAFEGTGGDLAVAYHPGERGIYVLGSHFAQPEAGNVYEVWMFRGGEPVRGGCLLPEPDGSLSGFLDASLEGSQLMAVTVEAKDCPAAPTSEPILTASLPTF